jgi:peptidase C39-like protein
MSVRLSNPVEQSRITALTTPKVNSNPGGWLNIPQINQLHPNGADKNYVNGAYNCGPAVVAMLARGSGHMSNLNDAQLINQLGKGIVTKDGTDPEGIEKMLKRADVPLAGEAMGADYDDDDLNDHLDQGHKVIAQVRATDASKVDKDDAHYVLIQGRTKDGNYTVSDPLASKSYVVTPQQLHEAVLKAPPDGGMLIPVAGPAQGKQAAGTQAPTQTAAQTAFAPARNGVAAKMMQDGYDDVPAGRTLKPATTAAKEPNPDAFTASKDMFADVDTSYHDSNSVEGNAEMDENEQRNQAEKLDVKYGKRSDAANQPTAPLFGDDKDTDAAAQELRDRKSNGDMDVFKLLAQLEKSLSEKDKAVLEKVKEADKKDPGIGKKMAGDGF